jgi:DNA mismatch repair protein MutL
MAKIKLMDELLANKIAAGEVVERCSSVVKELVENAIDAESTEIKIELKEAGTRSIKVIDDGVGMDKEDAVLAFNRHATSKLKTEYDLFHINTLGFRGEALASIASVSKVTLKTSYDNIGTTVKIEGGKLISVESSDARQGTIIEVEDLFYNTPARLKHMKSFYTELASTSEYVNKIALSYPNIKFVLINNGITLLNTDGTGSLLKTIKAVFGMDVARHMLEIKGEEEDYKVEGYMTYPEIHKSSRNGIVTLVNGRVVRNAELNRTINDAYHYYKPDNRYPVVVLNIEVDPSLIDVNIHPTKMDIKFSKMDTLLNLVDKLIKTQLHTLNHTPIIEAKEIVASKPFVEQQRFTFDGETKVEEKNTPYENIEEEVLKIDNFYEVKEEEKHTSSELFKEPIIKETVKEEQKVNPAFKKIYPIGLALGTYIVCHNEEGITLIDQHAAKERCNYEKFKKEMGNMTKNSIRPLIPFTFEFPNNEFIILKEHFDVLENIGYEIEEFGISSVIIKRHPIWLPKGEEKESIYKMLEAIITFENNFSVEKYNEKVATMLSCKKAIKANENISAQEMEKLIYDLSCCENPFHCPHGRPTMINLKVSEIEKLFKRSGF